MKVLFIVTAYQRDDDDIITPWLTETIERLKQRGTDVEVLAPSYRGSGTSFIGGIRVHRFRYAPAVIESLTHDMPALERIKRNPAFLALVPSYVAAGSRAAARIAREGNFDVVHAFWPIPHGLFAVAAKKATGAALVSTFFSAELIWSGMMRRLLTPVLHRIIGASNVVTVISSFTASRLEEYAPGTPSVTIPFGAAAVDHTGESASAPRAAGDPFELLFVGRLVPRKGVDVLLHAIQQLRMDSRLTLRVVGGGPEKPRLEKIAADLALGERVRFDGIVSADEIAVRFRACDALVLPAIITASGDTEGLGVVLIEAMGYGKPVIASAAGGILDIVADRDTGLLVPPGDAGKLAEAISWAMDNPAELAAIARRGTEYAALTFGWDAIVSKLSEVYQSAVAARAGT
jgi:glycosyltransferase involved in cell wall biosynthesis